MWLAGCETTISASAREDIDRPPICHNGRMLLQDAQKDPLLTRPTLARRNAPCPKQGRSE